MMGGIPNMWGLGCSGRALHFRNVHHLWAFSNVKGEMNLVLSVSVNILPSQKTRKDLISTIRIERDLMLRYK
jgi:hypothetical protein